MTPLKFIKDTVPHNQLMIVHYLDSSYVQDLLLLYAQIEGQKCKDIANIQYKKYCERTDELKEKLKNCMKTLNAVSNQNEREISEIKAVISEKDKFLLDLQNKYVDAIFKIDEMKGLLKECLEYVPQPSLIEDIAKVIS